MTVRIGNNKRMWLHLLAEGGRWSIAEIAEATHMNAGAVGSGLYRMTLQGMVTQHPTSRGRARTEFGVSLACKVPLGVTLAELQQIGVLQEAR